jgi:hypothetical protein
MNPSRLLMMVIRVVMRMFMRRGLRGTMGRRAGPAKPKGGARQPPR